ncbi:hypothetical protein [Kineosporia succinea]|uniref:TadE-like protein n=1 Tax=Kineosporia succinea TaxID=84632 RepID=A0ABT9P1N8_9ACTN|nr:hypothetical protein [Kineosporia succinea]MDP9826599.1 hypothetical protein [Kineosporia succinea]
MKERGQASIELLGAIPFIALAFLAALQLTVAAATAQAASAAARAAARTASQGDGDPAASARRSVPDWLEDDLAVEIGGGESPSVQVTVTMPIVLPGLGGGPQVHRTAWFESETARAPWG